MVEFFFAVVVEQFCPVPVPVRVVPFEVIVGFTGPGAVRCILAWVAANRSTTSVLSATSVAGPWFSLPSVVASGDHRGGTILVQSLAWQ